MEEQKAAELTALPEDYDLIEEMKEENNGESFTEEDHYELN